MQLSPEEVARKVRFLLNAQGVSYKEAAASLGLTEEDFRDLAEGKRLPTERTLRNLADLCGIQPDFFKQRKEPGRREVCPSGQPSSPPEKRSSEKPLRPARKEPLSSTKVLNLVYRHLAEPQKENARDLSARLQALIESLLEKGVITALDYQRKLTEVRQRTTFEKGPHTGGHNKT